MRLSRAVIAVSIVIAILVLSSISIIYLRAGTNIESSSKTSTSITSPPITSSSSSSSTVTFSHSSKFPLYTTYHLDGSRSGYDKYEPSIGSSVSSAWNSTNLDGLMYAEPLLADGFLYLATENDSVYALNESTGSQVWRTNLGVPIPGGSLPCGDIDPSGITGTPVINATANSIYVVAYVEPGAHELYSLNLETGRINFERNVDPGGADVSVLQQRGALALANGMVYVPYGGLDGDCGDYHGWIVGAPANNSGSLASYEVPTQREAGIWSPSGPSVEASGDLLIATGNSAATSQGDAFDYGDSVIMLSPTLHVLGYWAPSDWLDLNAGDVDVGSISPSILGNSSVIFQDGKSGVGYLLNESNLGGQGGELFSASVCDSSFGGTAFAAPYLYVPCTNGLFALNVNTGSKNPSFSSAWNATGYWAGPPIIAGGAVWTLDTQNAILYAYSMQTGNLLFQYQLGNVVTFETLTSGGGLLYVADGNMIRAFTI